MPNHDAGMNRHLLCVWLRWATETRLLEHLPLEYDPGDVQAPQPTDEYARVLLSELRNPDSSTRPLSQILADGRRFRDWVINPTTARRRVSLPPSLTDSRAGDISPETPRRSSPRSNPMWDHWLDG